ncbi:MAG: hypothetical protein V7K72_05285 [Nostoc sp.]|uniref:hypothetical protein n=1 Tax=Nostoc sp. TaxID=1180 RepID=UPI002FF5683D
MAENVDYEQIYQLTFRKQWAELLELVYKYSKFASSDELVRRAVNTFENEFFGELDKVIAKDDIETGLENLFLLHKGKIYSLTENRAITVVIELVNIYRNKGLLLEAYNYAVFYPKQEICAEVSKN